MAKNPFQARDRQHFPAYSPSMFKAPKTPSSTEKNGSFRWSIDHLAVLHPADINTRDIQQDVSPSSNDVDAQRSVERFFSQRMIVPSPWTQDKVPTKHVTFSPHPPDTAYIREESFNESYNGNKMVDASCQTSVTIPLNWDLEAMLGADCLYHNDEERRIKESGNTSLRRKLFGQPQRLSPNKDEATATIPCQSTTPVIDVTSPITTLATGPLLSDNMAATPNIIFTTSPSPSFTDYRSSFPVEHSPFHCMSPILTAPAATTTPADSSDSKGILSPKLSPIKAKSFVTPDGLATPNIHPSSGKSTSTPVINRIQPMTVEEGSGNDSSQSDSCTDSNGDHTPELLSLEDLRTNTYELTSVDMAMPSLITNDHDNSAVSMETTDVTNTTTKAVPTLAISHGAGVKSVSDSGIAGSSVEMSTQLRDDCSNNLQASCKASEQQTIGRCDGVLPSSSAAPSHNINDPRTIAKSYSGEHYKEVHYHPSAADSGLGFNLKPISHTHSTDEVAQGHLPPGSNIVVSRSDSTVDSTGTVNNLRTGFSGILLPSKYPPPFEESTPKSRYDMSTCCSSDKNRWAWLPHYTSNGESFSSFAEGVLLRKEMLKSQLQFGPVSSLCDCSNISPTATSQRPFSRYNSLECSGSNPATPLSSRAAGPASTTAVRYRSPLSDKVLSKDHSRMTRLHLGSFRSRFNRFTLDNNSATPVSAIAAGRLSPTHHPAAGRHAHSGRLWSSTERYNDWKRSMDRWESAIRTQCYATVDS